MIGKSPSYLSELQGARREKPPPDEIIIKLARALSADPRALFRAARRLEPDLVEFLVENPNEQEYVMKRMVRKRRKAGQVL